MARKYCPTCFYEFHEKVGVKALDLPDLPVDRNASGQEPRTGYVCRKRGHISKGAGLTLPELEKLVRFRNMTL